MLVRPKLEYASPIWNPHTSSQINRLERIQHYAARFVVNDHRRTTSPTLVLTLNWQTLERRRTIKQAMTFYKILNNIIEINPHTGLLTRSHNRHHFTIPRSWVFAYPDDYASYATWRSPDGNTKNEIDYIMTDKPSMVTDVTVINRVNIGSDHRMVMGSITLNTRAERRKLLNKNTRTRVDT